jgi:hypothetical protein
MRLSFKRDRQASKIIRKQEIQEQRKGAFEKSILVLVECYTHNECNASFRICTNLMDLINFSPS